MIGAVRKETKTELLIALLTKMQAGDLSSFDEFFALTKNPLYYSVIAVLKNETDTEDVIQETYLRFLENLPKINPKHSPLGYLLRIGRNLAMDELRNRQRINYLNEEENPAILRIDEEKVDDDFARLQKRMREILRPDEYQIVILHVLEELPHREVARILRKPLGTITWAYNNAIKKLEKGLRDYVEDR